MQTTNKCIPSSLHTLPPSKILKLHAWTLLSRPSRVNILLGCSFLYFQQTTLGSRSERLPLFITYLPWNLTVWLYTKTTNMIFFGLRSSSVFVKDRLTFSELWVEETVVTLSVNGPCRDPLPAVGHQCLSTWVWTFQGPGQGKHASDDGCQTTAHIKAQTSIWQLDDTELRVKENLPVSLFSAKCVFLNYNELFWRNFKFSAFWNCIYGK